MKPVVLPMLHRLVLRLHLVFHHGGRLVRDISLLATADPEDALELVRKDFDEARGGVVPVVENPLGAATGSQLPVTQQEISDDHHIRLVEQGLQIDGIQIAPLLGKIAALVEDVSNTATHASGEISPAGAKHQHDAIGHVLAAVVANPLDYGSGSGVADGKTLARNSVEKCFAAGGTVKGDIADDDVFFRREAGSARRIYHDSPPGEALPDVVVGFALERKRDSLGEERPQTLAGRAREVKADGIVGQSSRAIAARDLATEHAADGTVNVAHRKLRFNRHEGLKSGSHLAENLVIESLLQAVVLRQHPSAGNARGHGRVVEDRGKVQASGLSVSSGWLRVEHVNASDHLV